MKKVILWSGGILLVLLLVVLAVRIKQGQDGLKITVGTDTTRILGPLRADGAIDYTQAVNEHDGKGVKPEDNAAVPLLAAFGPRFLFEGNDAALQMGVKFPEASNADYLAFSEFIKKLLGKDPLSHEWDKWNEMKDAAVKRPWRAQEFPEIAQWLTENDKALETIKIATGRPRYFVPLTEEGIPPQIFNSHLESLGLLREAGVALCIRAQLRIGNGQIDLAIQDALACIRLGRMVMQGSTVIHQLVGLSLIARGLDIAGSFLNSPQIPLRAFEQMRKELNDIGPVPELFDALNLHERFVMLDTLQQKAFYGPDASPGIEVPPPPPPVRAGPFSFGVFTVHFDPLLKSVNDWFDRDLAALHEPTFLQRDAALAIVQKDAAAALAGYSAKSLSSENLLQRMVIELLPDVRKYERVRTNVQVQMDVVLAGILLREKFDGTDSLQADQIKSFAATLPINRFTGKPLDVTLDGPSIEISNQPPAAAEVEHRQRLVHVVTVTPHRKISGDAK